MNNIVYQMTRNTRQVIFCMAIVSAIVLPTAIALPRLWDESGKFDV